MDEPFGIERKIIFLTFFNTQHVKVKVYFFPVENYSILKRTVSTKVVRNI